jgi:hypothetical protein
MTTAEVLAEAQRRGVQLFATAAGNIHFRCNGHGPFKGGLPTALRQAIGDHKAELLALLRGPIPPWDLAAAEALLAELRVGLARIERAQYRGRFPPLLAKVVGDGVAVCEGYVRDHEQEAARGWDALELLRGGVRYTLAIARGDQWRGRKPPWET